MTLFFKLVSSKICITRPAEKKSNNAKPWRKLSLYPFIFSSIHKALSIPVSPPLAWSPVSSYLVSKQSRNTCFRGIANGGEVVTPFQCQHQPAAGQSHQLLGQIAKTCQRGRRETQAGVTERFQKPVDGIWSKEPEMKKKMTEMRGKKRQHYIIFSLLKRQHSGFTGPKGVIWSRFNFNKCGLAFCSRLFWSLFEYMHLTIPPFPKDSYSRPLWMILFRFNSSLARCSPMGTLFSTSSVRPNSTTENLIHTWLNVLKCNTNCTRNMPNYVHNVLVHIFLKEIEFPTFKKNYASFHPKLLREHKGRDLENVCVEAFLCIIVNILHYI